MVSFLFPGIAVAASVFTIAAMSVDRWLSISPEPRLRPPSRRQAVLLLLLLWCAALLIFIPLLMVATVQTETVPIIAKGLGNVSVGFAFVQVLIFYFGNLYSPLQDTGLSHEASVASEESGLQSCLQKTYGGVSLSLTTRGDREPCEVLTWLWSGVLITSPILRYYLLFCCY